MGTGKEKTTRQTNNTGELTALLHALHRASRRGKGAPKEIIWVDSLYARNQTMGIWLPRKGRNLELVKPWGSDSSVAVTVIMELEIP